MEDKLEVGLGLVIVFLWDLLVGLAFVSLLIDLYVFSFF